MCAGFTGGDVAAARGYDAWFDRRWGRYAGRVESSAVLDACGPVRGRRVVDVGCGTGRLAAVLAARGARVMGVDLDPAMLTVAAERLPGRVVCADGRCLPLAEACVDVAVTVATLEFTTDPARVLGDMARVTRPGGRLVAAVLNPASPWGWAGRVRHHQPYRQGCFLSRDVLLALGRQHGAARVRGTLFGAEQLPLLSLLGPSAETAGRRVAPRFGALQILTVDRAEPR